jgi:hypothetical protein
MTISPEAFRGLTRDALLSDECAMSHFGYADNFRELEHLLSTIDDLVLREEAAELDVLSANAAHLTEQDRGEFWAENHPYWWDHIVVPQFRGAFVISLMSAAELHLGRLANDAGVIVEAPIALDELRGGFYQRARRFLASFAHVELPEATWRRIGGRAAAPLPEVGREGTSRLLS